MIHIDDAKILELHDQGLLHKEIAQQLGFVDEANMVVLCHDCHHDVHYSDNHELSPYRWESATTIESAQQEKDRL